MQLSYVTRPLIESKKFKSILVGNFCLCENLKTKCRNAVSYSYLYFSDRFCNHVHLYYFSF